ncbi:MAG: LamG domain-containing protein, partial [Desulfobacterales bacterium]|nr:LamG domain-containing protein [Desulfobacterales bacterium]
GVVDRSNNLLRAYKNGVQVDTSDISTVGSINVGDVLTIGRDTWGWPDALIEEVRLSRVARSAEWIQTSYNNQNSPSSFY